MITLVFRFSPGSEKPDLRFKFSHLEDAMGALRDIQMADEFLVPFFYGEEGNSVGMIDRMDLMQVYTDEIKEGGQGAAWTGVSAEEGFVTLDGPHEVVAEFVVERSANVKVTVDVDFDDA